MACAGESGEGDPSAAVSSDDTPPTAGAPDTATAEPGPAGHPMDSATWSIGVTSAPATVEAPPLPVLAALRTGVHPEWVRITFEVGAQPEGPADAGGPGAGSGPPPIARPGYAVEYIDRPLVACGSGDQIFPVGDAWLEIRLEPAAAHAERGEPTLGPREMAVDGPLLQRIYRTCDFEGIVTYVLALSSPNPYRVVTLADPVRLVVDVQR